MIFWGWWNFHYLDFQKNFQKLKQLIYPENIIYYDQEGGFLIFKFYFLLVSAYLQCEFYLEVSAPRSKDIFSFIMPTFMILVKLLRAL